MKTLFTLLIALYSTQSYSQNCEYQKNEIDEFTKEKTVITKEQLLAQGLADKFRIFGFKVGDGNIHLITQYSRYGIFSVAEGSSFMFLLNNGEMVELLCRASVVAEPLGSGVGTSGVWVGKMEYIISDDQVSRLSDSPVKKIRMYTRDGYIEKNVKNKSSLAIQQILTCLSEN